MNPTSTDGCPTARALEVRAYQQRLIAKTLALFGARGTQAAARGADREAGSVLIESPTGSGKTIMGLSIARQMQRQHGMSVGWAAMRRNLLAQAQAENERFGFGIQMKLISMFDKRPPKVDLLIVDEAQHDAALSMANLHSFIQPVKILGLTATPFRTDRFKLCFEKVLRDAGIHNLIQEGYLSPYHHYTIPLYEPAGVADLYAAQRDRWGKSLIFFHTMDECRRCVARLRERGVAVELVTASTDRQRQIDDLASGRLDVLVNMLILAEGFDCPTLKTVFCRPSSKLPAIQMCGRVLRRHPSHAYKQIVQCQQTRYPFGRTARPAEQYLWTDAGWRSLGTNRQIDAMTARMQSLIAATPTSLPKFLVSLGLRGVLPHGGEPRPDMDDPEQPFRRPRYGNREHRLSSRSAS